MHKTGLNSVHEFYKFMYRFNPTFYIFGVFKPSL